MTTELSAKARERNPLVTLLLCALPFLLLIAPILLEDFVPFSLLGLIVSILWMPSIFLALSRFQPKSQQRPAPPSKEPMTTALFDVLCGIAMMVVIGALVLGSIFL